jgi:molybdopterin molybdotransferase
MENKSSMDDKIRQPLLTVEAALEQLLSAARPVAQIEQVDTIQTLGRVLAAPVVSQLDVPPLDNSAMDGYAVRCVDFSGAVPLRLPVTQRIPAGKVGQPLAPGSAARIFTGAPVPVGADAIVMQEDTQQDGDAVLFNRQPKPGEHIRRAGDDIRSGAQILPVGTRLGPAQLGLAASVGAASLPVYRRLRVATFFTGDEIVMPGQILQPGQIYNSNRFTLTGLLEGLGCEVRDFGIVPDNFDATVAVLEQAAREADLVITSGGVSVGEEDHVKAAVEQVGSIDMWRLAIKPGKPLAFGMVAATPFIGLPGNPVSSFATFCLLVRPFILRSQGAVEVLPNSFTVHAEFDWPKAGKRREFVRARLQSGKDGAPVVSLFPNQSSGVLTSVAWANGLVDIPADTVVQRGQHVRFIPFAELVG